VQGGQVRTVGSQKYSDNVNVSAASTTFRSDSATITFEGTLDGVAGDASGVVVNAPGGVSFGGAVGGSNRLTTLSSQAATSLAGNMIATQAAQTFNGAVTYAVNCVLLFSSNGPITFTS